MDIKFNVTRGQRFMLLVCVSVLGMIIGAVAVAIVSGSQLTTPRVRIAAVLQDIFIFLAPALVTSVLVTRRPADLLGLHRVRLYYVLLGLVTLVSAIPALNMVIAFNESIQLPEVFETAEQEAAHTIGLLMGEAGSIGGLITSIMIVGLLAPLCEELFFRGCLQRLLSTSGMNVHYAIWISAFIFSVAHMQMAGLVPRMLLGAFFGYMLYWSGSVWTAVAAHALNNVLATVSSWLSMQGDEAVLETVGADSYLIAGISAVVCALLLTMCYRRRPERIEA